MIIIITITIIILLLIITKVKIEVINGDYTSDQNVFPEYNRCRLL